MQLNCWRHEETHTYIDCCYLDSEATWMEGRGAAIAAQQLASIGADAAGIVAAILATFDLKSSLLLLGKQRLHELFLGLRVLLLLLLQ